MKSRHDSYVSSGVSIAGNLQVSDSLCLGGSVHGDVVGGKELVSTLRVMEGGSVTGKVSVSHLVLAGRIQGDVYADETLTLLPGAVIEGNVLYRNAQIHAGAVISGRMTQTTEVFQAFDCLPSPS